MPSHVVSKGSVGSAVEEWLSCAKEHGVEFNAGISRDDVVLRCEYAEDGTAVKNAWLMTWDDVMTEFGDAFKVLYDAKDARVEGVNPGKAKARIVWALKNEGYAGFGKHGQRASSGKSSKNDSTPAAPKVTPKPISKLDGLRAELALAKTAVAKCEDRIPLLEAELAKERELLPKLHEEVKLAQSTYDAEEAAVNAAERVANIEKAKVAIAELQALGKKLGVTLPIPQELLDIVNPPAPAAPQSDPAFIEKAKTLAASAENKAVFDEFKDAVAPAEKQTA